MGGKIVIWNHNDYIKDSHRQLDDQIYYIQIDPNPCVDVILEIPTSISLLYRHKYITYQLFLFLVSKSNARIPVFYLLPKTYKPCTPGRTIASGCDSPTQLVISDSIPFKLSTNKRMIYSIKCLSKIDKCGTSHLTITKCRVQPSVHFNRQDTVESSAINPDGSCYKRLLSSRYFYS